MIGNLNWGKSEMKRSVVPVLGAVWMLALLPLGGCKTLPNSSGWLDTASWSMDDATAEKAKNATGKSVASTTEKGGESTPNLEISEAARSGTATETAEEIAAESNGAEVPETDAESVDETETFETVDDNAETESLEVVDESTETEAAETIEESDEAEVVDENAVAEESETATTDKTEVSQEGPDVKGPTDGPARILSTKKPGILAKCIAIKTAGTLDNRSTSDHATIIKTVDESGVFRIEIERNAGGSVVVITSPSGGDNTEILTAVKYCSERKVERQGGWPLM